MTPPEPTRDHAPDPPTRPAPPSDPSATASAASAGQRSTVDADPKGTRTGPAGRPAAAPPDIPGYVIEKELGRGGMGVVYLARQVSLKRPVALKLIRGGADASAEQLDRFRTEAEAVAALQHPNIVQVYEVGEHEGTPFCALEYVPGGSLSAALDGRPWPAADAARLVETLARAIQHAHARGIIHRDLKPANILLAGGEVVGWWGGERPTPAVSPTTSPPRRSPTSASPSGWRRRTRGTRGPGR